MVAACFKGKTWNLRILRVQGCVFNSKECSEIYEEKFIFESNVNSYTTLTDHASSHVGHVEDKTGLRILLMSTQSYNLPIFVLSTFGTFNNIQHLIK